MGKKVALGGWTVQATIRATVSHSVVLSRNMDDDSNCKGDITSFPNVKTIGQAAQGLYKITLERQYSEIFVL